MKCCHRQKQNNITSRPKSNWIFLHQPAKTLCYHPSSTWRHDNCNFYDCLPALARCYSKMQMLDSFPACPTGAHSKAHPPKAQFIQCWNVRAMFKGISLIILFCRLIMHLIGHTSSMWCTRPVYNILITACK